MYCFSNTCFWSIYSHGLRVYIQVLWTSLWLCVHILFTKIKLHSQNWSSFPPPVFWLIFTANNIYCYYLIYLVIYFWLIIYLIDCLFSMLFWFSPPSPTLEIYFIKFCPLWSFHPSHYYSVSLTKWSLAWDSSAPWVHLAKSRDILGC